MEAAVPDLVDFIRSASRPAAPELPSLPADFSALVGAPLPGRARAVLFDIYGTLFTSHSGDIGLAQSEAAVHACDVALDKLARSRRETGTQLRSMVRPEELARRMRDQISADHARRRTDGVLQPEVEIRSIWKEVFAQANSPLSDSEAAYFALAYEVAANPVWPMPGAMDALRTLEADFVLGLVSNAQFYTPMLFPALLGVTVEDLGFTRPCCAYSYELGVAKPDPRLFSGPLAGLAAQGIDSQQVVYVGNDMLNDVTAAASCGCMTVLFAGDSRSLRLRRDDPAIGTAMPDSVARSLKQVAATVIDLKEEP